MGSWKGRGNQYIEFARVLYCKLPTNGKQLPAFPHKALTGIEPRPRRWEARVLPLCHRGPKVFFTAKVLILQILHQNLHYLTMLGEKTCGKSHKKTNRQSTIKQLGNTNWREWKGGNKTEYLHNRSNNRVSTVMCHCPMCLIVTNT